MFKKKNRSDYIPPEFRRKPFLKRVPEWWRKQVRGFQSLFGSGRHKNPSQKPLTTQFQQGFDRQLNLLFRGIVRLFRTVTRIRLPLWLLVPTAFLLGGVLVFAIMKQRRAASEVILVVDGVKITEPEFMHRMEMQAGSRTLTTMLEEELNLKYAASRHLLPTQAQVQERMKQVKMQPDYDTVMRVRHLTDADVERQCRVQLAVEAMYTQNISVTEDEARAVYTANCDPRNPRSLFYVPDTAYLTVITNSLQSNIDKANQELAQGKSFPEVAKRYSQDLTGGQPGKLTPIWRGRTQFARDPALERAIFEARPGQRIGTAKFFNTFWIIRVDKIDPGHTLPYEQVRSQCLARAKYAKAVRTNQPQLQADYAEFRKHTNIQIFWDQYYYDLTGQRR